MNDVATATDAPQRLLALARRLESHTGFDQVLAALTSAGEAALDGVWGSSCALLAAALADRAAGPLVVVCPQAADSDDFCDAFTLFSGREAMRFPAWESDPAEAVLHDAVYGDRLRTLKRLAGPRPPAVVATSIQSLLQPTPSPDALRGATWSIRRGAPLDAEAFRRWLVEQRFHHTTAVELPGEFSVRGGILDVFPPDGDAPVRVELFGDEVASIRRFAVTSQRSIEALEDFEVSMFPPAGDEAEHFAAWLPAGAAVLLVELEQLAEAARHYLQRVEQPRRFHDFAQTMRCLAPFARISAAGMHLGETEVACRLPIESVERFSGDVRRVRGELEEAAGNQEAIVVCLTEAEIRRLGEVFQGSPLAADGRLHFALGRLRQGFRLASANTLLLSGAELFQRTEVVRVPRRQPSGRPIDSFLDLRKGDLVVHLSHGVGRYRGLTQLEKNLDGRQQIEEHLEIEFHGGTKVYVPASKIDLVQKYVGGRKARPSLARIGGKTWVRQKKAAEKAVSDLAADLLGVQAARAARPGIAFAPDTDWQREFDASFPYPETPDQLAAIAAIKADMQSPRPMDRLLCGDVGYGKTELAIRAAFKAIDNGYQVAVMAPTTILVEQHFHTFRDRMAEFPVSIARLSRFASAAQQRQIIAELKSGNVDLVIGTHRLASRDVEFANLGLLIIDEEQRFGVEVKERIKSLRTSVDVLTMTATPIPRTLHMSLVGLRDISNLQTPPEDRLAVETKVARFDERLIRHAVLRELSRRGQIYFVHNRVQDIAALAAKLQRIVPEARLRIGHGQMPEHQLERVMVDFVEGRFDLLLATTIVESGLDIPNANTIFIDEADRYGLADLHQLRGRVGRYKHRAYCYLLLDPRKHITPNAARRLRAIEEYSHMGAGFAIAMRDLEIRGAGNMLGAEQSGHIAAVGYELYCRLLEGAVRRLKRLPPRLSIDVDIDLPGEAFLPSDYIPEMRSKIDLYRRLTRVASDDELAELRAEMEDRFGPLPLPAARMLDLAALKIDAAVWRVDTIRVEDRYLVFGYTDRQRIEQLARLLDGKLRVVDAASAYVTMPHGFRDPARILQLAKSVLRPPR